MIHPLKIMALLLLTSMLTSTAIATQPKVVIEFFYQPGCHDCENVTAFILPQLEETYSGQYELRKYDTGVKENVLQLIAMQERLKVDDNATVSMVVNSQIYLGGYENIKDKLFDVMTQCLDNPVTEVASPSPPARQPHSASFTIGAVMVAGLTDGINPCVFSTLIFFITLLLSMKVKKGTLLLTGSIYCLACFLTYLTIGFGLFRFLKLFSGYHWLQTTLNMVLLAILLVFAMISFVDAWRYRKTGRANTVTLQLPTRIKNRIHNIMHRCLKYRFLLPGIFGIGVMVTVLESVCTGQVYIPTLILLTQETGIASKWFLYLLLYNMMFIVPLIILFVSTYLGTSTSKLLNWSKRNVIISKLLLGLLFLTFAIFLFRIM